MKPKHTTLEELEQKWMQNPKFVAEYHALDEEFAQAAALIKARADSNMTQAE
ncbi:MAG: hypothetical protein QM537_10100 [Candidatus Symbiobacter sp.]|nr:hypothetical protein [Candidatus Symbiobacter sp.]